MSNVNKILIILIIALILVLAGIIVWRGWVTTPAYYAVSLKTGELYFGELNFFPSFKLSHIYLLQVNQNSQTPVSVQKFTSVFWGPEDYLKINKDEVVWMTKLKSDSQLVNLIKTNPNLTGQAPTQPLADEQMQQAPQSEPKSK